MAEYYNVTTNTGDAEIAAAIASGNKLNITHIAFGDGNGAVPTPSKTRNTLIREVYRQAVNKYERHPTNSNWIVIEAIIPSGIGGFTIREMGVIANNKLISHGSHAPFEKVADPTGVSEYRLKFTQNITDGAVVAITLDESLIFATQAWVEENFIKRSEIAAIKLPMFGIDQTWQDVSEMREWEVFYTNLTGKPIQVLISFTFIWGGSFYLQRANENIKKIYLGDSLFFTLVIPNGDSYKLSSSDGGNFSSWWELRK